MAIPALDCEDLPEPCCDSLYSIAAHLLAEGLAALGDCCPAGCEELAGYVTMGVGDDGITDALTVTVTSIASSAGTVPGSMGLYRATFDVRLRESGWPTAYSDGSGIVLPSPSFQLAAARYMFSRGETLHRRLAYLASSRTLTPSGVRCSNGSVGILTPLFPAGGVVGWTTPVTIDLPWG